MWKFCLRLGLILIVTLFHITRGDDEYPASCAMRPICADYRTRIPKSEEIYYAEYEGVFQETLKFNLRNDVGNNLTLSLAGVQNGTFRVTVEEPDQHRYHLEHSLEKEPVIQPLNIYLFDNVIIVLDDNGNSAEILFNPLHIKFYRENVLEMVLDAKRLIMENTEESQAFTFAVQFPEAKRLVGLHERSSVVGLFHTADLKIDPYRFKNVDYGHQRLNSTKPSYGAVPLIYGIGNQSSGIFLHNAAEMWIDIDNDNKSAYFMVYRGVLDLFVLPGPTLASAVRQYTDLTGTAPLPQLWALGYHQSRYGYKTEEDVKYIVQNFDQYQIPLESVWLDLDYTVGCRYFTWNSDEFPDPVDLMNWVDSQANRKMVVISDPHFKVDPDYIIYETGVEKNYFITKNGSNFVSTCWPGDASWMDFLNPEARNYYASLHSYDNFPSTPTLGGYWNDMNEPASFNDNDERSLPYDVLHYGNVTHGDVHNIYGLLQVMATYQGLIERDQGKLRPFILSRSMFAGSQRYTANWAGDTGGSFNYLRMLVPQTISSNLAGFVFYGGDIPGFFGDPTDELATRWYQLGSWIPFFRAHGDMNTLPREPWAFSNETRELIRETIELRYQHLAYWYTQFFEHSITGDPVVRPLFYHYPNDDIALDINDEFLVGSDILVASVYFTNATSLRVYLPGESDYWFQITGDSNNVYQGGQWYTIPVDISFIPVFYKSGSIITRQSTVGRSTAEMIDVYYELHILVDQDGFSRGTLYYDDFQSFDYLDKKYGYWELTYNYANETLNAHLIDEDADPSGFNKYVDTAVVYINNGNGTYTTQVLTKVMNLLKKQSQLTKDE